MDIYSNRQKLKGEGMLALAAVIWGTAFIFQKMGMDYIGPFTFGVFRFAIGALILWVFVLVMDAGKRKKAEKLPGGKDEIMSWTNRELLKGGLVVGVSNFVAGSLQQIGIVYTTAGKAGFITAMDIVIVPFFLVLLKRKVHGLTWLGVVIAAFGLYLLCIKEGFNIELGDGLVMGCAVGYSIQILCIDYYVDKVDPFKLSFYEFAISAVLSLVCALIFETIEMSAVIDCASPVLYTGILEVAVAFTLQIVGQKYAPAAIATIIMAMESVFAALAGFAFLGEVMTGREITGCIIMFAAFIIAQIPEMRSEE